MKIKIKQSQATKPDLLDEYQKRALLWHQWLISGKSVEQFFNSCAKGE